MASTAGNMTTVVDYGRSIRISREDMQNGLIENMAIDFLRANARNLEDAQYVANPQQGEMFVNTQGQTFIYDSTAGWIRVEYRYDGTSSPNNNHPVNFIEFKPVLAEPSDNPTTEEKEEVDPGMKRFIEIAKEKQ